MLAHGVVRVPNLGSMNAPDLLTSAQVAKAHGISLRTLRRWIADGRVTPITKLPGRTGGYLFDSSALATSTDEVAA